MAKRINTIGLEMPDDFPADEYNATHDIVRPKREPYPPSWDEWAGGWNAVAYRFAAVAEHDEEFTRSVAAHGGAPGWPERYRQEKEWFGFLSAGVATIESFFYSLYAAASMMKSSGFPMATFAEKRQVIPASTTKNFQTSFVGDPMTVAMRHLLADSDYRQLDGLRNVAIHRVVLGRDVQVEAGGSAPSRPTEWKDADTSTGKVRIVLDSSTTGSRRKWLSGALTLLVKEAAGFARRYASRLPPECR